MNQTLSDFCWFFFFWWLVLIVLMAPPPPTHLPSLCVFSLSCVAHSLCDFCCFFCCLLLLTLTGTLYFFSLVGSHSFSDVCSFFCSLMAHTDSTPPAPSLCFLSLVWLTLSLIYVPFSVVSHSLSYCSKIDDRHNFSLVC